MRLDNKGKLVIAINASPRKKWNTAMLLGEALKGASEEGFRRGLQKRAPRPSSSISVTSAAGAASVAFPAKRRKIACGEAAP
jgi:hypothetical protein